MGDQIGLLFHIQIVERGNLFRRRIGVGSAFAVAAGECQCKPAQPCAEALLVLPDVGQFMYQPYPVAAVGQCEVGGAALFGEVDAAVG